MRYQIQRIWRNSFQYELDKALETRLCQSALVSVKAALEAALVEELDVQLIVDGVWVTILYLTSETWTDRSGHRWQQVRGQERIILAALAVWPDGRYHIIHYKVAEDEDGRYMVHLLLTSD